MKRCSSLVTASERSPSVPQGTRLDLGTAAVLGFEFGAACATESGARRWGALGLAGGWQSPGTASRAAPGSPGDPSTAAVPTGKGGQPPRRILGKLGGGRR